MVFFNCNACGEAVKKNQVEKHVMRCRNCQSLSCVDCGKDFWGDDYQKHTRCMTEEEKYYGRDYVPKSLKGDTKQVQWIEKVQVALKQSTANPKLRRLLETLQDYPNIPRKKKPFENFLSNSLRVYDHGLVNQVWDMLSSLTVTDQNTNGQNGQTAVNGTTSQKSTIMKNHDDTENKITAVPDISTNEPLLNKRQRKEERRKKQHKSEKKEKLLEENDSTEKKRSKKRKHTDDQENNIEDTVADVQNLSVKKKKKKAHADEDEVPYSEKTEAVPGAQTVVNDDNTEAAPPCKKQKKTKFSWESVILAVLESKGEITMKKLRKKVLNEFASQDTSEYDEEKLKAKFNKKILKIPAVKVSKDRASLRIK